MTLGFRDRDSIVAKVVGDVSDGDYGSNWNLGIPPCFEANETLDEVVGQLRQRKGVVVADITSDTMHGASSYVRRLHSEWSKQIDLAPLGKNVDESALDYLLASLPSGIVFVQVVRQFHKIIETMGVPFLGQLRDAEQRRAIRTVTATPLTIPDLKKRWDRHHPCTVSGYGNGHSEQYVECHSTDQVIMYLEGVGFSRGVARFVATETGGYPECVNEVVRVLRKFNAQTLSKEVKATLTKAAVGVLRRFVILLDDSSQKPYRDAVIDLFYGIDEENAAEQCQLHPWRRILLQDSNELRSSYLGDAAIEDLMRDVSASAGLGEVRLDRFGRALKAYRTGRFGDAAQLFSTLPTGRREFEITKANATLMQHLFSPDAPGEDTEWPRVVDAVRKARLTIEAGGVSEMFSAAIGPRLQKIERIATNIVAIQKRNERRIVDALAGLRGCEMRCDESAAFLLLSKYEASCRISGSAAACQASLALPEQLLRVWAFWAMQINFYQTPVDAEAIWRVAEAEWQGADDPLRRSSAGAPFGSLVAFGYFVLAAAMVKGISTAVLPVQDFAELKSIFTRYEQLRNPQAHAYCFTSRKEREQFFVVAGRWLESVLAVCPAKIGRTELMDLVAPLPLLGKDGEFVFP